jgi:membrane complex biogenesis BtpA family protein
MILLFNKCKPLIGVVHLPPLPGSPGYKKRSYPPRLGRKWGFEEIVEFAVNEARKYEKAGFDAVIIENYGDKPYPPRASLGEASAVAVVAREASKQVAIPVGVSILRNSGYEAVYAALLSGASFIRVNNLCDVRISPEGILYPAARDVAKALSELELYDEIESGRLSIMADVNVKHSWSITKENVNISELVEECINRTGFRVAAIIVSGPRTGIPPAEDVVRQASEVAEKEDTAVVIGSGITSENLPGFWRIADGFIVGTWVKVGRITENMVSVDSAKRLAELAAHYRNVWPCSKK